jgi:hypothetical protein
MPVASYRHAKLMRDAQAAGVTVEDLARASASYDVDGSLPTFDEEAARGEATTGVFVKHVTHVEWLLIRATEYARELRRCRCAISAHFLRYYCAGQPLPWPDAPWWRHCR